MRAALVAALLVSAIAFAADDSTERREVRPGERFAVTLNANPTTGYAWALAADPDPKVLRPLGSSFERPADAPPGAGGQDVWTFDAVGRGNATITLVYRRPWEQHTPPARTHVVTVRVAPGAGDPFAYCQTAGDVDRPAEPTPPAVAEALSRALNVPPIPPDRVSWRCMKGSVWACTVGANIQCNDKVDMSRTPTAGMRTWCKENPSADVIPAYATGRSTAWEWRCQGEEPAIVREVATPDARGFDPNVWHAVTPP
jgi:predicted secreted protein